jgi:hypothetical protein
MTILRTRVAATAALLTALTGHAMAQRGPTPPGKTGIAPDVLAAVCAPRPTFELPDQSLRITGGQDSFVRRTFAPGDLVTLNAGTDNGIEVGQEYFVRRLQTEANRRPSRENPASVRTAGWIKVYAVDQEMSLATIVHACDTIDSDDYLEPFEMPVVPKASTENIKPQRDNYGHVMFGADYRRAFGKGDFFIVDRGSDHGVAPGDRFVVYRNKHQAENFLYDLGEAVAIEVKPETSTLQVTVSRDYFAAGDLVAIRK